MSLCRLVRPLALIALMWTLPGVAQAGTNTWTSNGPAGQWIRALAQSPTALYAGTQASGVFESTDGGGTWSAINSGLTGVVVSALGVDPVTGTTVYAGTTDAGAFRSIDGGASWTAINTGLTTPSVLALAIDEQTPTTVYAGTNGGGIFKSLDGGSTWAAINTGNTAVIIQTIAIDPTDSNIVYLGSESAGVFKSLDAGLTWTNVAVVPADVGSIVLDPTVPDTIYVGSVADGIFKSTDAGGAWTLMTVRFTTALAIDPATPSTLYAGTLFGGILISLNAGSTWIDLNDGLTNLTIASLLVDTTSPALLHAGTSGVFQYLQDACNDGGVPVTCGICETCVPAFGCIGDVWLGCGVSTHLRKAKLTLKLKEPHSRDRMVWTLSRGEATLVEAFGDPENTTQYHSCIFDESAGPPALVMRTDVEPALICNSKPCWKSIGDRAFKYRNGDGIPNGATKLILKSGDEGKTKIILKAKGELLELPSLPMSLPFRLQLQNDLGECWEAIYTTAGVSKNDQNRFVGKNGL